MAHVRLDKEGAKGYGLAYKKMFDKCFTDHSNFEVGKSPKGVDTDWSDAEIGDDLG
jgi:hypothetical protein